MHPMVRDLYKRVIHVGYDYPLGLDYVRKTWKKVLRNPDNCPSCFDEHKNQIVSPSPACEREIRKAVGKGRAYIREMIGIIQLKKYRVMKKRYDNHDFRQQSQELLEKSKAQ
mmetsp:Transcript_20479/g.31031  ORF Transcript_20479/g.31031 Transcript_20479/m.31031 type:complete len:112 (+) Transcript_20479:130-465(+)|eukprot:CAMPEP_0194262254 /NCGR_PEP_ID=MMETSP0158-20130606/46451_1 /TAXON_ID=33649 /ORGANISM="Thalassionema nitzschioides, Strain L26-B" /LENGTH=111 /DNA_ID=CAMNT_0039002407 /DNA_START=74 /DNA_END=409 /DNA_ORIENTATION=-